MHAAHTTAAREQRTQAHKCVENLLGARHGNDLHYGLILYSVWQYMTFC
jgi:hypothetical protein